MINIVFLPSAKSRVDKNVVYTVFELIYLLHLQKTRFVTRDNGNVPMADVY